MPACTVCTHSMRPYIDAALAADETAVKIAKDYGVSEDAVGRHRRNHLVSSLAKADVDTEDIQTAGDLVAQINAIQTKTAAIFARAEKTNNIRLSLQAIKEMRANLELLRRIHETDDLEAQIDELTKLLIDKGDGVDG